RIYYKLKWTTPTLLWRSISQRAQRAHCLWLEEEKAHRRGKVYNWETTTYGKIGENEDVHDLRSVEIEFPAVVFNDTLTSEATLSFELYVQGLGSD
ncbi:hypothetical protein Tco_0310919, partial [Tanacetum coccineum]